jgi:hypothetical protein
MTWRQDGLGWAAFGLAVAFLGVGLGCVIFYGMLDRAPPRTDISGVANKPAYHACDFFDGTWTLTVASDRPGRVIRKLTSALDPKIESYLSSEDVRVVAQRPVALPSANFRIPVASFRIPCQWPPGETFYHVSVDFYNNWFQEWVPPFAVRVNYPVISFMVVPPIRSGMAPPSRP